jgi:transposase-like protein
MGKNIFAAKHFHDEDAARAWFEAARWDNEPNCPKCGSLDPYKTKKLGVYRCKAKECRKDFTVMTGTVMERSHAKLTQWAMAFWLGASSKKGFSAHQLHRALGCQYNTAWFLHHRVMEAMRMGGLDLPPMSGPEGIVETDETYFGPVDEPSELRADGTPFKINPRRRHRKGKYAGPANKRAIVTLVERHGKVRSFHVPRADKATVRRIVADNIAHEARLHTDESGLYKGGDIHPGPHEKVNHSKKEYVRYEDGRAIHINSAEGYFSIFKRGMKGVYQHCSEKHLHRYLAEFDFRYNHREALGCDDEARCIAAIRGAEGKRLTYHQPSQS